MSIWVDPLVRYQQVLQSCAINGETYYPVKTLIFGKVSKIGNDNKPILFGDGLI